MAAISVTVLSVTFLLAAWFGEDRGLSAWLTVPCLIISAFAALTVLTAVGADTRATIVERRPQAGDPSAN